MIRQVLTVLFCAALFTAILAVPVEAKHPTGAPYFCINIEDALQSTRYQEAGDMETLGRRAKLDETFKCWYTTFDTPFYILEILHEYRAYGVARAMVRAIAPDGTEVFLFGIMKYINIQMHQEGA